MPASFLRPSPTGGSARAEHRFRVLAAWIMVHQNIVVLIALALWIEVQAALTGGDSNWDLRNYHLYNPFALFNGKYAVDIAPAGPQTYFAPTLDIPYYFLVLNIASLSVRILFLAAQAKSAFSTRLIALAAGGLLGGLATAGWWWAFAWQHWGSPLFPLYNNIFHSPLITAETNADARFIPSSLVTAILYPFLWALPGSWADKLHLSVTVGESYVRDPRIAIALVCDLFLLAGIWRRRSWRADRNLAFIAIFFLASL